MSASQYLSKHIPGLAAGVVDISAAEAGVKTISTGLKEITAATANLKTDAIVANEEGIVAVDWGGSIAPGDILITVEKIGSASGDPADSDVSVSFMAHGDR